MSSNETDAIRAIKTIVRNLIDSMKLADLIFGEVKSLAPLRIRVDQKLELEDDELIISRGVKSSLSVGDTVPMIRQSGGQLFYVLGEGGDPDGG
jgi:hypothetical protein